jgi:Flp pilus assembly pilin Flp
MSLHPWFGKDKPMFMRFNLSSSDTVAIKYAMIAAALSLAVVAIIALTANGIS